ncbi:hypothetical protein HNY73_016844 [Argiope bruennichi]|uniref:Uncharacterized protein n=1 Tax=Argiope bruennichi TaxID=94029 RepID=A0A8T0ENM8_ARGBR|nr:hypothetical protein HNY73_016844 [Argiope bruennichi]
MKALKTKRKGLRASFTMCATALEVELSKETLDSKATLILKLQIKDKFDRLSVCQEEILNEILKLRDSEKVYLEDLQIAEGYRDRYFALVAEIDRKNGDAALQKDLSEARKLKLPKIELKKFSDTDFMSEERIRSYVPESEAVLTLRELEEENIVISDLYSNCVIDLLIGTDIAGLRIYLLQFPSNSIFLTRRLVGIQDTNVEKAAKASVDLHSVSDDPQYRSEIPCASGVSMDPYSVSDSPIGLQHPTAPTHDTTVTKSGHLLKTRQRF